MSFDFDKQTISDLEIFRNDESSDSIFKFYNRTKTPGGEAHLIEMMSYPLTDIDELRHRVEGLDFIRKSNFELNINYHQFGYIIHYLKYNIQHLKPNFLDACFDFILYKYNSANDYYLTRKGIDSLLKLFTRLKVDMADFPDCFREKINLVNEVLTHDDFSKYFKKTYKLNFVGVNKLDFLFRTKHAELINEVIGVVHELDAYVAIAQTAQRESLVFAEYVESNHPVVEIDNLYHPNVENPVPYDITIAAESLCFLSGPNMAGKSTYLKSIGLAIYLSHIGFPVPATRMTTSIFDGIITTINLADNLNKGYSHFYTEVMRVKETAIKLKTQKNYFIIFDELFRGTNVKDAFDASLAIIRAFSKVKTSSFLISTHITEIAEEIKKLDSVDFKCFNAEMVDNIPVYNYKVENGVSHERLGLHIVKSEGILEVLESLNIE